MVGFCFLIMYLCTVWVSHLLVCHLLHTNRYAGWPIAIYLIPSVIGIVLEDALHLEIFI